MTRIPIQAGFGRRICFLAFPLETSFGDAIQPFWLIFLSASQKDKKPAFWTNAGESKDETPSFTIEAHRIAYTVMITWNSLPSSTQSSCILLYLERIHIHGVYNRIPGIVSRASSHLRLLNQSSNHGFEHMALGCNEDR